MIAATPPFATNEPAADEVVEEEAGVVAEAGEEAVVAPLVELAPAAPLAPAVPAVPVAPLAPVVPERVNGIALGVALGPVALRLTVLEEKNGLRRKTTRIQKEARTRTTFCGL